KRAPVAAASPPQAPDPPENSETSSASGARGGAKRKSAEQPEDEQSRHSNGARRSSRLSAARETSNADGRSAVETQQQDATTAKKEEPARSLTLRVRDQTGEETYFKVHSTTAMSNVIGTYCKRKGVSTSAVRFLLEGRGVGHDETVASLELEDEDQIDAILIQSGGKPVILLYPSVPLDTTVTLELSPLWRFSALYPKPPSSKWQQASTSEATLAGGQQCKWKVHASPDGSLEDLSTGREYPYLFWEADSTDGRVSRSFGLDVTRSFCVAGDAAALYPIVDTRHPIPLLFSTVAFVIRFLRQGVFLDDALERLGLSMRERCDMVTYWLPQLESSAFNIIYFVDVERYEKAAHLTIAPAPDVMIRVFMAFRWVVSTWARAISILPVYNSAWLSLVVLKIRIH
ncbi:unnamed protein product, partial [Ectocarpus fasciculatus]